jgi:hypothetical protein
LAAAVPASAFAWARESIDRFPGVSFSDALDSIDKNDPRGALACNGEGSAVLEVAAANAIRTPNVMHVACQGSTRGSLTRNG